MQFVFITTVFLKINFTQRFLLTHIIYKYMRKEFFYMDQMVTLISNTCFPIAVAAYLLVRFESKIDNLSKSINDLSMVVKESGNKS